MKRTLTIVQAIRELLAARREAKQKERITKALKAHAKARSDAAYHEVMTNFYTARALSIDPYKDHNAFAEARNSEDEHETEWIDARQNCDAAEAHLAAEQARYLQLHNGHSETGK